MLCLAGVILLLFFNSWNWFLVLKGFTTIEYWTNSPASSKENKLNFNEFQMEDWKDNLDLIFGTKNIWRALFVPSIKKLPFSGLEYTALVFPNFRISFMEYDCGMDIDIKNTEDNMIYVQGEGDSESNGNNYEIRLDMFLDNLGKYDNEEIEIKDKGKFYILKITSS